MNSNQRYFLLVILAVSASFLFILTCGLFESTLSPSGIESPSEWSNEYKETPIYEEKYTYQLEYNRKSITKFYNHNDNTTIWILRMAGYGDSSLFVMKGKV